MPKVCLTAEDKRLRRLELAEDEFRGILGKYKAKRRISDCTCAEKLGIVKSTFSKRMHDPLRQLSIADLIVIVGMYGVTDEEIITMIRKGVSGSE